MSEPRVEWFSLRDSSSFCTHSKADREKRIQYIRMILETKAQPHNYKFAKSDMQWRHVGKLDGNIYLFDHGDLVTEDSRS